MKKIGKYLSLTILLILGLGCVGILYLFFIPTATLFNLTYITHHSVEETEKYNIENISDIELNSYNYDVRIFHSSTDEAYAKMFSNSYGFVLTKNESFAIKGHNDSGRLVFTATEPKGLIFKSTSYIELYIPEDTEINLTLSNNNAKTNISLSDTVVKNFKYTTKSGNLTYISGSITESLHVTLNKATFEINSLVSTDTANFTLSVTSGKLKAGNSSFADFDIIKNTRGTISIDSCLNLKEILDSAGGKISANLAQNVNITSSETNVYIKEITDGGMITLTGSGDIKIDSITGSSSHIYSAYGDVKISASHSEITVGSINGDIDIKNATQLIQAEITGSGDLTINFAEDTESNLANPKARAIAVSMKSGKLNCSGVERVSIIVSENATINLSMTNVVGENIIEQKHGSSNIIINKDAVYKLTTNPTKETVGKVKVYLSQIEQYNGYTNKDKVETWVNCNENSELSNTFIISSETGNITILDTNLAK